MAVVENVLKALLALVIIAFALYCLLNRRRFTLEDDRLAWLFGFAAGCWAGSTA
jgi:hypothetical protein